MDDIGFIPSLPLDRLPPKEPSVYMGGIIKPRVEIPPDAPITRIPPGHSSHTNWAEITQVYGLITPNINAAVTPATEAARERAREAFSRKVSARNQRQARRIRAMEVKTKREIGSVTTGKKILDLLASATAPMTGREIREAIGITHNAERGAIKRLLTSGEIEARRFTTKGVAGRFREYQLHGRPWGPVRDGSTII